MTQAEFLQSQLKRAGANLEDEKIKQFLSQPQLAEAVVPDEVAGLFQSAFMTLDNAKNNPEVSAHFKAMHLDGVDAPLNEYIKDFDEAVQAELKALPTAKRAKRIIEEVRKLEGKKAIDASKDNDSVKNAYKQLQQEILEKEKEWSNKYNAVIEESEGKVTEAIFDSVLSGIKYGNDLPSHVNKGLARQLILDELKEKKALMKREGIDLKLYNAESPLLEYSENNQPVKFQDIVNRTLAKNKLIEINKEPNEGQQQRQPVYMQSPGKVVNPAAAAQAAKIRAEYNAAQ